MGEILELGGAEVLFVQLSTDLFIERARAAGAEPTAKALRRHQEHSRRALRCTVLGRITGRSLREQSMDLAMNPLYRNFCGLALA